MTGRIDFHAHILPYIDHGSDSVKTSLAQLALLREAGVDTVVATPHFYPDQISVDHFLERRYKCMKRLSSAFTEQTPQVFVGAEVLVCPHMETMDGLEKLCVEGTNVLLLEMPLERIEEEHFETVSMLCERTDLRIVLAHIDRYAPDDIDALMELPLQAQINASSLCSLFKRHRLQKYFDGGRVWALASDLHKADKTMLSRYQKGLAKAGKAEEARVNERAALLLEGAIPMRDL